MCDPGTASRLDALDIQPGWRVLEVAAGRGSVARMLSERVGPDGHVVAVDLNPRFLTDLPANVEVRQMDVRAEKFKADAYDLAHCRALLMHLPDPDAVLQKLAAALRPGGVLLVEEGELGLMSIGGHEDAAWAGDLLRRIFDDLRSAGLTDAWFGRTLPDRLAAAGLEVLGGEATAPVCLPGDPGHEFACSSIEAVMPLLLARGIIGEPEAGRLIAVMRGEATTMIFFGAVEIWARRPVKARTQ
jgi:SAM-dependent methyltransferase